MSGTKKCPYCGEEIDANATKCRFCSANLNDINSKVGPRNNHSLADTPSSKHSSNIRKLEIVAEIILAVFLISALAIVGIAIVEWGLIEVVIGLSLALFGFLIYYFVNVFCGIAKDIDYLKIETNKK